VYVGTPICISVYVGPGNITVVRLPGPETLRDLGPTTRGAEP